MKFHPRQKKSPIQPIFYYILMLSVRLFVDVFMMYLEIPLILWIFTISNALKTISIWNCIESLVKLQMCLRHGQKIKILCVFGRCDIKCPVVWSVMWILRGICCWTSAAWNIADSFEAILPLLRIWQSLGSNSLYCVYCRDNTDSLRNVLQYIVVRQLLTFYSLLP